MKNNKMKSAEETKTWLIKVFPSFEQEWDNDEKCHSLHQVFQRFTPFFGSHAQSVSDKQLIALGDFINRAVEDSTLENAASTCFLEHLKQIDSTKVLRPYLSKTAKRKTHA